MSGSATDLGISIMLLGSISFMMATFYLVNHRDRRMQQYSWQVISSTISIFSAVLLFQGVNGVVEYVFELEDRPLPEQFMIDIVQMFCWFGILQLMLGYFSGSFSKWHKPKSLTEMQTNMKTFAVLLGHITGFSAINAWGTLQQIMFYDVRTGGEGAKDAGVVGVHGSTLRAAMVIPIAYVAMSVVYTLTEGVRMKVSKFDNDIDQYEMYWMTETEDTENDVTALTISWLVVQVLRLVIGGYLPNQEGEEPEDAEHTVFQSILLVAVSIVFAVVKGKIKPVEGFHRTHNVTMLVLAMSVAWCFLFSTTWIVVRGNRFQDHMAVEGVVLALISTCVSFSIILLALEAIELRYQGRPPELVERAVYAVVESLGILVGFSWERSFDAAIKIIAEEVTIMPQPVTKLCLAIALFSLVGPAWRLYILPGVLILDEEERLEQEEVALKSLYGKLMAGTIEVTHHMVQAPLEYLMSHAEGKETEELQEQARERLEVMERAMKIESLSKQHDRLAEQSILLATRLAHLGHTDVLKKTKDEMDKIKRAADQELALLKMEEVDRDRQREIHKLNQRIAELEAHTRAAADRVASIDAGTFDEIKFEEMEAKVVDSEMRAQKAEGEVVQALEDLANAEKEAASLRVDNGWKNDEIERLQLQLRRFNGVEKEERVEEAQVAALQMDVAAKMEEVAALRRQLNDHGAASEVEQSEVPSVTLTSRNASGTTLATPVPPNNLAGGVVGGLQQLVQEGEAQAAALLHTLGARVGHGHGQTAPPVMKATQTARPAQQQVPKSPIATSPISPISPASLQTRTRMNSAPVPWRPQVLTATQRPGQEPPQTARMPAQEPLHTMQSQSPRIIVRSNPTSTTTSPTQVIAGQPVPISPSASQAKPQGSVVQPPSYLRGPQAPWVQQVANNSLQTPLLR